MILVTGATGHLGSHILHELSKKNLPVRAVFRNPDHLSITREIFSYYHNGYDYFNRIEWVQADINDFYTLHNCLNDVSLVFHTAGFVSFNDADKERLYHINAEGTSNVVNACLEKGNIRLCYVSSIAALGDQAEGIPVTENIIWNRDDTASAYSRSKHIAEMEVWRGIHEGLDAVIVNPSVIIGPGMWHGPGKNLWNSILSGLHFYIDGSAGYVDVRDVAEIMILLAEKEISGERFILNSGHLSHREFLLILAKGLNSREPRIMATPFLTGMALTYETVRALITGTERRFNRRTFKIAGENFKFSNEKIQTLTGIRFIPVEESLRSAIEIYHRIKGKNPQKKSIF